MLWHDCFVPADRKFTLVTPVFIQGVIINNSWMMIDSSPTCNVVCDSSILSNIHEVEIGVHISFNYGRKFQTQGFTEQ